MSKAYYDEDNREYLNIYNDAVGKELKVKNEVYLAKGNKVFNNNIIGNVKGDIKHIKRAYTFPDEIIPGNNYSKYFGSEFSYSSDNKTSQHPFIIWQDGDTAYFYTAGNVDHIYMNEDSTDLFNGFSNLIDIETEEFDTSRVTNMSSMFAYSQKLEELDLSSWDVSNVENMNSMFSTCSNLNSLNVTGWNTSNVTNMRRMFYGLNSLQELDVSSFDTTNVTDMSEMFRGGGISVLDLSDFVISSSTNFRLLLYQMEHLTEVDTPQTILSTVTNNTFSYDMYPRGSSTGIKTMTSDHANTKLKNTQWS